MGMKPKPAMAAWIARERKRLNLKPADLAARLGSIGLEVSEQTVRVWEGYLNRNPSRDNIDGLERIFGTRSPDTDAPAPDQFAVVAAIDRLTAAVEAQTRAQTEGMEAMAGVLGVVLHRLGGLPEQTPAVSARRRAGVGQ